MSESSGSGEHRIARLREPLIEVQDSRGKAIKFYLHPAHSEVENEVPVLMVIEGEEGEEPVSATLSLGMREMKDLLYLAWLKLSDWEEERGPKLMR